MIKIIKCASVCERGLQIMVVLSHRGVLRLFLKSLEGSLKRLNISEKYPLLLLSMSEVQ